MLCMFANELHNYHHAIGIFSTSFRFDLMLSVLEISFIQDLFLHAVGHQLKRHWHANAAGRFFLASRQGLSSSLITRGSPLLRSPRLFAHFPPDRTLVFCNCSSSYPRQWWSGVCCRDFIHSLCTACSCSSSWFCFVMWLKVGCPSPETPTKSLRNRGDQPTAHRV